MSSFRNQSFRSRLFLFLLTASLIPVLICSATMVQFIRIRLENNLQTEAANQIEVLQQSLDNISTDLEASAARLQENRLIARAMSGDDIDPHRVNTLLYDVTEPAHTYAVFDLYTQDGTCLYSTGDTADAPQLSPDWGLLYGASTRSGEPYYYGTETPSDASQPMLSCAVKLHASGIPRDSFLVMRIYLQGFHVLLDGKYPANDLLVLNPYFHPLYASHSYLNTTLVPTLREDLMHGIPPEKDVFVYNIVQHAPTGLYLVLRQQNAFSVSTLRTLYTIGVICVVLSVIVSVFLALHMSHQVSQPVLQLKAGFDRVEQRDLSVQLTVERQDEMGQLATQFNEMVNALRQYRDKLVQNQIELKDAQIRMLQAQLNPHFLGNTLDTMKWIGKINNVPQVALLSTNLADILRFAISSEEFVPLYREMEILERYIEIQQIRLGDDFRFTTSIPEEYYDCMVPKMMLQPIVENAIIHGLNGVTGSAIHIKAEPAGTGYFRISVFDNGVGLPAHLAGRPYRRDKDLAKGHLGLYNVDTILTRSFGDECGLFLDHGENGKGACVSAALPIRYEEESEC